MVIAKLHPFLKVPLLLLHPRELNRKFGCKPSYVMIAINLWNFRSIDPGEMKFEKKRLNVPRVAISDLSPDPIASRSGRELERSTRVRQRVQLLVVWRSIHLHKGGWDRRNNIQTWDETIRLVPIFNNQPIKAEPAWWNGRALDSGSITPGCETRMCHLFLPLGKEINRHC